MAGKNFPTSKEDVLVPTYYLDIDGLAGFWAKAKQYINNQNLSLNGQNIPLYPRGTESNISITSAINNIKNQKATTDALGLIKVGSGLSIDDNGVLSTSNTDSSRVTIEYSNGTLNMSNVNEIDYNAGTLNLTL